MIKVVKILYHKHFCDCFIDQPYQLKSIKKLKKCFLCYISLCFPVCKKKKLPCLQIYSLLVSRYSCITSFKTFMVIFIYFNNTSVFFIYFYFLVHEAYPRISQPFLYRYETQYSYKTMWLVFRIHKTLWLVF